MPLWHWRISQRSKRSPCSVWKQCCCVYTGVSLSMTWRRYAHWPMTCLWCELNILSFSLKTCSYALGTKIAIHNILDCDDLCALRVPVCYMICKVGLLCLEDCLLTCHTWLPCALSVVLLLHYTCVFVIVCDPFKEWTVVSMSLELKMARHSIAFQ